ncbi:uncharacterized protein QC764_703670 [Podospora pseudoanserina]|uniref:Uncharacterized protein n=1 Tax=Podospora pseudoanserina TaxID=2609844 RepID=A0ABR0HIY9_9PEZI|nr:hypothetical protein QC764_703670 [Podospora pseudoanserina]
MNRVILRPIQRSFMARTGCMPPLLPPIRPVSGISTKRSMTFVTRKPGSTYIPKFRPGDNKLTTLIGAIFVLGGIYVFQSGRVFPNGDVAEKYLPKDVGNHRQGTVNKDYKAYNAWVTEGKKSSSVGKS